MPWLRTVLSSRVIRCSSMTDYDPTPTGPERHDERDTMFARMASMPDSPGDEDHYARRPEPREPDDRVLRRMPLLGARGVVTQDMLLDILIG